MHMIFPLLLPGSFLQPFTGGAITHFTHHLRALALRREGNCLQNNSCFPQSIVPLAVYKSQVLSVLSGNERYCWTGRNSYLVSSYLNITPDLLTFTALHVWSYLVWDNRDLKFCLHGMVGTKPHNSSSVQFYFS